jgi:putative peptidoglycan lipid II flippase
MTIYDKIRGNYLFRNASITASLAGAGAVSGLILDALILFTFGVGYQTDAFFTALTVPTLLNGVFSIQCPKVLVPAFSEYFSHNEHAKAWALLRNLITASLLVFLGVWLAGIGLSAVIVPLQIPGLERTTISLAIRLSQILFGLILCQGLASIMQSALYAQHSYLVACSGKLVTNLVTIAVVVASGGHADIRTVAAGMLLGAFVQVVLVALVLSAHGFRYRWTLDRADHRMREILESFRYPLFGHVLGESSMILQNVLGSFLGSGSLTLLRYASRIVQSIAGVLLGSVVQVTLPLIAKYAATKDLERQRKALLESIQLLSLLGLPVCVWLIFAAEPVVKLMFQRGAFSATDAVMVAVIIRFMVPDLLLGRIVSVTQTLFYANSDLRTPFVSTLIYTIVNTGLAIVLASLIGVRGVAMAVSFASVSNTIYMIVKLQKRFGPVGWSETGTFALRLAATCLVGAAGFALGTRLLTITTMSYSMSKFLAVAIPSTIAGGLFIAAGVRFRLVDGYFFQPVAEKAL